jgi:thioredoxin-related protein
VTALNVTNLSSASSETNRRWFWQILTCLLLLFCLVRVLANEVEPGQSFGAKTSEAPEWFKQSFLDFEEDIAEASARGKRLVLYFHQEGCPYCARLVDESFSDHATETYMRKHFEGITINLWGDREVVSVGGQVFSEKTFAAALGVQYTPTLLFLDEQGRKVLRLNGYYPRKQIQTALRYVAEHRENEISFSQYVFDNQKSSSAPLLKEDFYIASRQLDQLLTQSNKPLAVYFESGDCDNCQILHQRILTDKATRNLVVQMSNVQFDIQSDQNIITPDGRQSTPKQWARKLGLAYTPSVVFFDVSGNEVMRIAAFMKTFHFQSVYDYVLQQAYLNQPSFQRYISERAEKIREAGFDTNIWGYESSHE